MKIRTYYVTNSSSASNAEVMVDNLVLLEILQRYKEMGLFGEAEPEYEIGSRRGEWEIEGVTKTPAFYYVWIESAWAGHPRDLDEVLITIIDMMDCDGYVDWFDQDIFKKMKEELLQRKEEISTSYTQVIWRGSDHGWGESEPETGDECEWDFQYDPVNGEKYKAEYYKRESDNGDEY